MPERLGNPWVSQDDAMELARISLRGASRAQLQRCEHVANNVLIFEGVVARAGALRMMTYEQGKLVLKRLEIAESLYRKTALGAFRSSAEKKVLYDMSHHVPEWVRYLSYFPGNDFMDLLAGAQSRQLYFPS